jgi:hypothetical protein
MTDPALWQRRFSASQTGFPAWSASAADHLAFVSNESGSWQAWVTDLASGEQRRVSDEPVGVEAVLIAPDGRVVWWRDDTGDERRGASDRRRLLAGPSGRRGADVRDGEEAPARADQGADADAGPFLPITRLDDTVSGAH